MKVIPTNEQLMREIYLQTRYGLTRVEARYLMYRELGWKLDEIAELHGVTHQAVNNRLRTARRKMGKDAKKQGGGE